MANIIIPTPTIEIAGPVKKDGETNGGGKTAITAVKAQLHYLHKPGAVSGLVFCRSRRSHPYKDEFPPANFCRCLKFVPGLFARRPELFGLRGIGNLGLCGPSFRFS